MHDEKGNIDTRKSEAFSKKARLEGELTILTERLAEVEGKDQAYRRRFMQETVGLKRRISDCKNTITDLERVLQAP